jgi:hypothetical protein
MVSEQSYMSARKWSLALNIHLRVAVEHPFLAFVGLKEAHTLQHDQPPSSGTGGGALLFPPGCLACAHKQLVLRNGGKIVLVLENS